MEEEKGRKVEEVHKDMSQVYEREAKRQRLYK